MGSTYTVFTPKTCACAPEIENRAPNAHNAMLESHFMYPIIPDNPTS